MKIPVWLWLPPMLLLLALTPVGAHKRCDEAECEAVKAKIRTIESKMRSGYTRAQGERYETRLRELRAKRYKVCR